MKKYYKKPLLKSRKIELGVFGDYGRSGGPIDPSPLPILDHLDLHME